MRAVTLLFALSFILPLSLRAADDLPNFREVNSSIFRSGRPTQNGLAQLKTQRGVKTIINLEDSDSNVQKEAAWAKGLGIDYLPFPTNSFNRPDDQAVTQILEILKDQTRYPILIHCHHGEDRTGLMIGLHRVFNEGWTPKAAYQEMLDLGFHTMLSGLKNYFKEKTGLNRRQENFDIAILDPELAP